MSVSKQQQWALALLFVYFIGVNYLVFHAPVALFSVFDPPELNPIEQVQFVASEIDKPSLLPAEGWQDQTLPDDWYQSQHATQQLWYRAKLALPDSKHETWALYLPAVTHNAAAYINGVWVGQGGRFEDPVSRHHNEPLLFSFSEKLLVPGENQILVRVKAAYWEQGLLDHLYLAPLEQLEPVYLWKRIVRVDTVQWLTIIMYLMAALLLVFWIVRPQDKIYGLFSLELFLWATHNLNLFVHQIPVSSKIWEAMTMSTLGWTVATMIVFNHRYVGVSQNWVDKAVMLYSAAGVGIFFLPDIASILHIGYRVWDAFLILFGSYAIYFLVVSFWKVKNWDVYLMMLVGVPILVFGFHDILTVNHLRDRREGLLIQYSLIPAAVLFSWFLLKRFVSSLNQAERLASNLERRVAEKEADLAQQFERLKELEHQRLLAEERERIMRDIHDGIGGQLISVITTLQDKSDELLVKTRERIQTSLMDLRWVIDSLDPLLLDLTTLLGSMRYRINEQIQPAGLTLDWQVSELPALKEISPQKTLHVMRIVQEAINNVVKHSGANRVTLRTESNATEQSLFIEICDDGNGFDAAEQGQSCRGLANMAYRARQLHGQLDVASDHNGTSVRLTLPTT